MKQDQIIDCNNCKQRFVWTISEQGFYEQKNLSAPIYCMICRSLLKTAQKDQFRGKAQISPDKQKSSK